MAMSLTSVLFLFCCFAALCLAAYSLTFNIWIPLRGGGALVLVTFFTHNLGGGMSVWAWSGGGGA